MFVFRAARPLLLLSGRRRGTTSHSLLSTPVASTSLALKLQARPMMSSAGTLGGGANSSAQMDPLLWDEQTVQDDLKKTKKKHYAGSPQTMEANKQILARVLGLSPRDVNKVPQKLIDEDGAKEVFHFLQKEGFGKGQILEHPNIFMLNFSSVVNYIEIMKESQFSSIRLPMIVNFRNIHKQGLRVLQEKYITLTRADLVKNYCHILTGGTGSMENELWNVLPNDTDRLTLADLRKYTLATYLAERLDLDVTGISQSFMKYPRLEYRCLTWVKDIVDSLLTDLAFPKDKILKHPYLLHGSAPNIKRIITEIKTLSGIPLRELVLSRPKILMSSCSSLLDIEVCFKEHKIPSASIAKYPEIFTLSPKTVRKRLEELDEIPEFIPLKSHPRVIRLLYYQNKAKARIEHFRSLDISGASLHLLSADTKRYKNLLALGEMKNRGTDVVNIIRGYLGTKWSSREVRENLMRHPHWLHSNVVTAKESIQFIDSFNVFSKDQMFSALPLVLYPKEKIEKEFENVVAFKEAEITDEWFLHMVLYFLERSVHFSGDGIWSLKGNLRDEDDRETAVDEYSDSDSDSDESN